jgi:hypothetical protein
MISRIIIFKNISEDEKMSAAADITYLSADASTAASADAVSAAASAAADILCDFSYGTGSARVQIQVPESVLRMSSIICDLNTDCPDDDGKFYATIETIHDTKGIDILFTKNELELFFELAAHNELTNEYLETRGITISALLRFLCLANFLDYGALLNSLCAYTAHQIKLDKCILN